MKIGILTGGGDVPGLNPCIKAVVYRAAEEGHEVIGIRRGWGGLLEFNRDDPESFSRNMWPLDRHTVRTIDRTGGTFLHSSRTHPGKVKPKGVPDFWSASPTRPSGRCPVTRTSCGWQHGRRCTTSARRNLGYVNDDNQTPT